MDPEADLCPGATLLNKVLEAVPSTEGQERIDQSYTFLIFGAKPGKSTNPTR